MTSFSRWRQLVALIEGALGRPPGERSAYLRNACASDSSLREEAERILAKGSTPSFLDDGALAFAAPLFDTAELPKRVHSRDGVVYELERELGRGGMATVYLARESKHDRLIALKVLDAHFMSSESFVQEIRLMGRLQHPLIVGLVDSGVFGADTGALAGRPYYSMPYVQGESLRSRLARGRMSLGEAIRILHDVAEALAYAHGEGVVHRDIKPANILLSRGHAVVADFGIATALSISQSARGNTLAGTPAYMAPEQLDGGSVDARSDLYSYGVVAYEILAGQRPFADRKTASQLLTAHRSERPPALDAVAPDLPRRLASLVMQLLEKDPSARPQDAGEVLRALEAASIDGNNGRRRNASWLAAAAVLLVAALGATTYAGVTWAAHRRAIVRPALRTNNPAARALYEEGRQSWARQRTANSMRTAAMYFQQAIAADPNFANAYAGLADVYTISPLFEVASPLELFPKAKAAALRAVELDSTLAETHASLARIKSQYDGDLAGAQRELERAIAIEPRNAILRQRYAELLWWRGRHDEAFREADRALALDSLSRVTNMEKGMLLVLARRPDEAIAQFQHTLRLDPEFSQAHASMGAAYLTMGRAADAVPELEKAERRNESSHTESLLAYAYASLGQMERARAILRSAQARARQHYVAPTTFALIYAGLRDSAEAIRWLEQAAEIRDPNLQYVVSFSFLDWLHADPRVAALVRPR